MRRKKRRPSGTRKPASKSAAGGTGRAGASASAKSRFGRRYSPAERARILAAARTEKLTAAKVRARFGVSALTFYRWRRESGAPTSSPARRRAANGAKRGRPTALDAQVRNEIRSRVRALIPRIIEEEIRAALKRVVGRNGR